MDLTFLSQKKLTKERLIWFIISIVLFLVTIGLVIWSILVCIHVPKFTEFPTAVNQEKVTLKGVAKPNLSVVLFDKERKAVAVTNTDGGGNFVFENITLVAGENRFSVRALNAFRKSSKPSKEIIIKYDTTAPTLELQSAAGITVNSQNYILTGRAEPGSTVVVNGITAMVNPDGTWSATVPLNPGSNTLNVVATDSAGNTASTTQEVTYIPGSDTETNTNALTNAVETDINASVNASTNIAPMNTNIAPPQINTISVTGQVSNPTPNVRSNETIIATVKDSNGNPVIGAVVKAVAHYKSGNITYNLGHSGGGIYTVSFKVGTSAEVGHRVLVDISATFNDMTATTQVSFTPRQ